MFHRELANTYAASEDDDGSEEDDVGYLPEINLQYGE